MTINKKADKPAGKSFPELEEEILNFWDSARIFKKSVDKPAPQGNYVFYDGPPFGTGEPHYGHLLSSIAKDVVPRYWTMRGYRVERRWGWDCHGLPIENIIEQELGISGKKQIEQIGVAKFNEACRARVLAYADIWDKMIRRVGRWVEFKNSYKTMDTEFMESVWWAFKQLWQKKLVYQGRKVLLYCPRCETPISNFEVAMDNSYKEITETSVYVKFKLKQKSDKHGVLQLASLAQDEKVNILAWTTTPWTLPGNVALAVGADITYVMIQIAADHKTNNHKSGANGRQYYILARDTLDSVVKDKKYKVVKEFKGQDLVGLGYEPLFEAPALKQSGKKVYYVAAADFVTTEEGTGVVHTAVVYGEDDYNLGLKLDLPVIPALDEKGVFNDTVPQFKGVYFKKADKLIIADLEQRGLLFSKVNYQHAYPFCHRCDTQLFYNAIPAWFLNIAKIRQAMLKQNEKINWFPAYLKQGRFAQGIEQAPDWNISRNRYFATPIPIWQCDQCGQKDIIGSIEELMKRTKLFTRIIFIRHGQSKKNVNNVFSAVDRGYPLTKTGLLQAKQAAQAISGIKVDLIYSSPVKRARETAAIIAGQFKLKPEIAEQLREIKSGDWEGKGSADPAIAADRRAYKSLSQEENYRARRGQSGESWQEVEDRSGEFIKKIAKAHLGKTVVIVTHQAPIIYGSKALKNLSLAQAVSLFEEEKYQAYARPIIEYIDGRRGQAADIHNHFIDGLSWACAKCRGQMRRIKEVFDCWIESGSMSFAQLHYPFENKDKFERNFPAQFISEYISQTRAWFYVMHVMSTALFNSHSFENVISTGVILNEQGEKMSKSKKNFPDPWKVINQFGVDALRFYLMASPVMQGDNINFNERELRDVFRKQVMLLWNVFKFYELFSPAPGPSLAAYLAGEGSISKNVLDRWILARLNQLINEVTEGLNEYNLPRAARPITDFIDDLSTWYLRRSRDRFKGGDEQDKNFALQTTGYVLLQLAKVIAPLMPFMAEQLWQKVSGNNFKHEDKSVHLADWPVIESRKQKAESKILEEMEVIRKIVELGLAKRDEAGIKVRQPLNEFRIKNYELNQLYIDLIKDELNVKQVKIKKGRGEPEVELDTKITPELKQEGIKRELVRLINDLRKQAGLTIKDRVKVFWQSDSRLIKDAVGKYTQEIGRETLAEGIIEQRAEQVDAQKKINLAEATLWLGIKK